MGKLRVSLEAQLVGLEPEAEATPGNIVPLTTFAAKAANEKATVYLPRPALKLLKQIAQDQDKRINHLLEEGVDLMLAHYGHPSLKEFEAK
jgi:hypothetical protein